MQSKHGFITDSERSELMAKIKSKDTKPELLLRKALWNRGIRYRINSKSLPGKPDLSIKKYKIVIFVDGEFWHGYNWKNKKQKINSNRRYWIKKIEGNIARDKKINEYYLKNKWKVFRFWGHQLFIELDKCVDEIQQTLFTNSTVPKPSSPSGPPSASAISAHCPLTAPPNSLPPGILDT